MFCFSYITATFVIEAMAAANAMKRKEVHDLDGMSQSEGGRVNVNSSISDKNSSAFDVNTPLLATDSGLDDYAYTEYICTNV